VRHNYVLSHISVTDPFEHLKTDSVVDRQVSVAGGDVLVGVEVVSESQVIGSIAGSGVGAAQEAETRRREPSQVGIAGADEHFQQVTANGQVAELFKTLEGSTPRSTAEATTCATAMRQWCA